MSTIIAIGPCMYFTGFILVYHNLFQNFYFFYQSAILYCGQQFIQNTVQGSLRLNLVSDKACHHSFYNLQEQMYKQLTEDIACFCIVCMGDVCMYVCMWHVCNIPGVEQKSYILYSAKFSQVFKFMNLQPFAKIFQRKFLTCCVQ